MERKKISKGLKFSLILGITLSFFLHEINLLGQQGFQEGFDRANRLYEEGKYTEALEIFQEVEVKGAHWKLFYNMGNCYYKLNHFVKAKIYYLRAEKLRPFEPSIQRNIEIVNKRFKDQITEEEPDFIEKVVRRIETLISLDFVSVVLVISIFALNLFIFLLIRKGKNRGLIYGISFSLIIALLVFGYHIYRAEKQNLKNTAVIVKENSELRSGPGETNTILFKVNPGIKVKIIDKSRDWFQVSASQQVAGWIKESSIERI